jgi:hypothetical protein
MDDEVTFMVRGKTRTTCQHLGAQQTSRPSDHTGRGWVARATLRDATKPPAEDQEPAAPTG